MIKTDLMLELLVELGGSDDGREGGEDAAEGLGALQKRLGSGGDGGHRAARGGQEDGRG